MSAEYPASRLLELATTWLAAHYPGSVIVPEFSIGAWGAALIDVAAISEEEIIGVEIKGDGDSPTRIALQAAIYSKAATRMFLLPSPSIESRCFKHAPPCWGRLRIDEAGALARAESYGYRREGDPPRLCTAPEQLLQALWSDELRELARLAGFVFGRKLHREGMQRRLAEEVPLQTIRQLACGILRRRNWRAAGKAVVYAPATEREAA